MTPAARYAAAIAVLDAHAEGVAAEQALTRWARGARYAGSKDRAAVRDIVFDALRRRASSAWLGGGETGRALVIGLLRGQGVDPASIFTGEGHGPAALRPEEREARSLETAPRATRLDMPIWALDALDATFDTEADAIAEALRDRAPIGLRTAVRKGTREALQAKLAALGHIATPHEAAPGALTVAAGSRGLQTSDLFQRGVFEFQDPGSQGLVARLPIMQGDTILDYCAGGGGKALAIADVHDVTLTAHDAEPARMKDLPTRARRAGVRVAIAEHLAASERFDGVICDVPCSGSGAWRRTPEARWRMTPERVAALCDLQAEIIDTCLPMVAPGGWLAYMTCSLFAAENAQQTEATLARHPGVTLEQSWSTDLRNGTDGFYLSVFRLSS